MSNRPNPTSRELEREDAASVAADTLALYESAKDSMVAWLATLHRANPNSIERDTILYMICDMEVATCWQSIGEMAVKHYVYEAIADGSPEGAKEAIDDHFACYLKQARAIAAGESL